MKRPSPSLERRLNAAPDYILLRDFLKLAGIGRTHFYKLIARGTLRGVKIDGKSYIPREEADRFLHQPPQPLVTPTMRRMSGVDA
jgi:excisionase family DNA binding protein